MNERILTNKNHGMRALVLWILAFVASIFLCVIGSSLVDTFGGSHVEGALGVFLLVLGILWVSFSWIFLCGLKVLKPQEALVLTLFGKYVGTLKGGGLLLCQSLLRGGKPGGQDPAQTERGRGRGPEPSDLVGA